MKFIGQDFQRLELGRQTDRHTDRHDWTHYRAAFADSNNQFCKMFDCSIRKSTTQ